MKIKTWIKYEEGYIPPRCRKMRYKECEEYVDINLKEVAPAEFQLAFEDNSYSGKGKIYFYDGKLWVKRKKPHISIIEALRERGYKIESALDLLIYSREHCSTYFLLSWDREHGEDTSREAVIKRARADMRCIILVDGELYEQTTEPRYRVCTFGLGNNHGGTGLFVDYCYNQNIRKDNYFSALEGDMAVAYANDVAARRGDTKDVGRFEKMIVVHMPEIVKVKPQEQHGNGNKILNDLNDIVNGTSDKLTAGLLCMAYVANNK